MKIAIVTDSTSDLPPSLAAQHNIRVVPAVIVLGNEEYEDGHGFSRREFYERLPGMDVLPTTAAPATGRFQALYDQLFAEGAEHIISVHLASALSGMYNAARVAAEPYDGRVHVVDSQQITMGLGFQALAAAQAVADGANLPDILHLLAGVAERTRVIAMLDTLKYLRRSGRVSFLRASLGSMLRVRIFIKVRHGQILPLAQIRTRRKAIAHFGKIMQDLGDVEQFAMLHTNAEAEAKATLQAYRPDFADKAPLINVTTIIGTHVGPNGLGFATVLRP